MVILVMTSFHEGGDFGRLAGSSLISKPAPRAYTLNLKPKALFVLTSYRGLNDWKGVLGEYYSHSILMSNQEL